MVRTRIAPSPTGEDIHIGNLYTALLNFAWARRNNGQFIVRIEDTDQARKVLGSEEKILQTLKDYNLFYDEGPDKHSENVSYRQSERLPLYKAFAEELVDKQVAYYCFCSKDRLEEIRKKQLEEKKIPKYDKHCLRIDNLEEKIKGREPYVIRLNMPANITISFIDVIRGEIKFNSNDIDDQVLMKSDGYPTYHLAVVYDDKQMGVSHVIRAEDWISSTPKHVFLYDVLNWERPVFAHVPLLRNPDHSKLSKRKNPVWASWYLEQGFLPEAILNFLALMGWSHPEGKEIFSIDEFIRLFDLKDLKPVGPIFDIEKLKWMNGEYIRKSQKSKVKSQILNFYKSKYSEEFVDSVYSIAIERIKTLKEFGELVDPFLEKLNADLSDEDRKLKTEIAEKFKSLQVWDSNSITNILKEFAKEKGINFKKYYKIFFDKDAGLPLGEMFFAIGKEKTLKLF